MRSEFEDINRFVDFVRQEEQVRKDVPESTKRAYKKVSYTLPNATLLVLRQRFLEVEVRGERVVEETTSTLAGITTPP
jgi:hypothetical protein